MTEPPDGAPSTAPVAVVVFNRPDTTRRTLERIREAAPSQLFVLANGPRPGNPDDPAKCRAVQAELEAIDWPCPVHRRYFDVNRGADANIELGLDWVFDQVDAAIVLEDDCVGNSDFFRFCSTLLEHYRDTDDVWQISGRASGLPPEVVGTSSYCFTAHFGITGWATWRRAWQRHRRYFPRQHDGSPMAPLPPVDLKDSRLLTRAGRRYFTDVARQPVGSAFSWDAYWCLSIIRERGLAAVPTANLVVNIGFGADATHTQKEVPQLGHEALDWPLSHPSKLEVNADLQRLSEQVAASHVGRTARFVARRLPQGPVRTLVRGAVATWRDRKLPLR
jgi:hypothetical protein